MEKKKTKQEQKIVAPVQSQIVQPRKRGLITEEFLNYTLANLRSNLYYHTADHNDPRTLKSTRFSNPDYYPFYSLGFSVDPDIPSSNILSNYFEMDDYEKRYGGSAWKNNSSYVGVIKNCIERKHYNLLLFMNHKLCSVGSGSYIQDSMIARFKNFVYNTPYSTNISSICLGLSGTYLDLFNSIKMCNSWCVYAARKVSGETEKRNYLCNMFFMASLTGNYAGSLNGMTIKPLFCLMVKKENMPLIRAYFASNLPIPVSMLEMWVDESVEAEGSKIKPHFRKFVKSKMEASMVPIRYFSDLRKEILSGFDIPKFKTHEQYREWANGMVLSMYDVKNGISRYIPQTSSIKVDDPRVEGILNVYKEELSEVIK